ncbi:hypothetical protein J7L05_12645 [bacterium]|nr:hypothetical protein [bacterium]
MKNIILMVILIIIFSSNAYAVEGSINICGYESYDVQYSDETSQLFISCTGEHFFQLNVFNPLSLALEKTFTIGGLIRKVIPLDGGSSLLVLVGDVDNDEMTEDGVLRKIDYDTGITLNEYQIEHAPLSFIVDDSENYAYISHGLSQRVTHKVTKVSLSDFTFNSEVEFGSFSYDLVFSPDGTKLYVLSNETFQTEEPDYSFFYNIGVFNTSGVLTAQSPIEVDIFPDSLVSGTDGSLYIGTSVPSQNDPSLIVVDMQTDQITDEIYMDLKGLLELTFDPINEKLYALEVPREYDPDSGLPTYDKPSNIVMQIDVNVSGYPYRLIGLNSPDLWLIDVVPIDDPIYNCRIFATPDEGPGVFYIDVE